MTRAKPRLPTPAQRTILAALAAGGRLFSGSEGHWWIQERLDLKLHARVAWSLYKPHGWIAVTQRDAKRPFWRTDWELTDAGRAALSADQGGEA